MWSVVIRLHVKKNLLNESFLFCSVTYCTPPLREHTLINASSSLFIFFGIEQIVVVLLKEYDWSMWHIDSRFKICCYCCCCSLFLQQHIFSVLFWDIGFRFMICLLIQVTFLSVTKLDGWPLIKYSPYSLSPLHNFLGFFSLFSRLVVLTIQPFYKILFK